MDLRFAGVDVTAAGNRLVTDLDLHVRPGEVVGLVGPNGSGKSSTLRCAFRAVEPSAGTVHIGGDDLLRMPLRTSARVLAALPQESHAEFDFSVSEVVAMGRTPHRRGPRDDEIVAAALADVDCAHLAERGFLTLSGGEKQRVLLARALAQRPRVLVLDEPTNHLDIRHQVEILSLLRQLGMTTLTALHDLNLAAAWCDRVHVLDRGRVVAGGPPREVLTAELVGDVFGVRAHVVDHPESGAPQLLFTPESGTRPTSGDHHDDPARCTP